MGGREVGRRDSKRKIEGSGRKHAGVGGKKLSVKEEGEKASWVKGRWGNGKKGE